jgi:flavin-dependent dehydrogenase
MQLTSDFKSTSTDNYDVVIMGAGIAGNCQARHLLLNIPGIRIAIIDYRPEERADDDLKLGESTVEVATLFMCKDLGLYEYVIENHPPKYGLNFHWPKQSDETENIDNYFHIWANRQPDLASIQLNRAKFERDLLRMNIDKGAEFLHGKINDVELTEGDSLNFVKFKSGQTENTISCKHLIDASGRRFLAGRKAGVMTFDPDELHGVKTGSAWIRVRDVDRNIFHSGYDPLAASCSHYYATNHWFGCGHWLWMIPTDTQTMELSIGVVHHHNVIQASEINTEEKFYSFLEANHKILFNLLKSGKQVDFNYLPRLAHSSSVRFSPDNWYLIGDAACIFDAFYSMGSTMIVSGVQNVTEIVRSKLNLEEDAEEKCSIYNEFNLTFTDCVNLFMRSHEKQLGNASIMSWRIYFENMFWFGMLVPMHVGSWHLNTRFIPKFIKIFRGTINPFLDSVHTQLTKLSEDGKNIGFMDCYRADQLINNYHTPKRYDHTLENAVYEPFKANVYRSMSKTLFYMVIWYVKLQWKSGGLQNVLSLTSIYFTLKLLLTSLYIGFGSIAFKMSGSSRNANTKVSEMRDEFNRYQYRPSLIRWTPPVVAKDSKLRPDIASLKPNNLVSARN